MLLDVLICVLIAFVNSFYRERIRGERGLLMRNLSLVLLLMVQFFTVAGWLWLLKFIIVGLCIERLREVSIGVSKDEMRLSMPLVIVSLVGAISA